MNYYALDREERRQLWRYAIVQVNVCRRHPSLYLRLVFDQVWMLPGVEQCSLDLLLGELAKPHLGDLLWSHAVLGRISPQHPHRYAFALDVRLDPFAWARWDFHEVVGGPLGGL